MRAPSTLWLSLLTVAFLLSCRADPESRDGAETAAAAVETLSPSAPASPGDSPVTTTQPTNRIPPFDVDAPGTFATATFALG